MAWRAAALALAAVLAVTGAAWGHGVTWGVLDGGAVAVQFGYAGGEPMSYVEVRIHAPGGDPDLEFQNGRTDARGVFAFVPDAPGAWTVEAWDESGHRGEVRVDVGESGRATADAGSAPRGASRAMAAALGLSILANLAFGAALLRRVRRGRS